MSWRDKANGALQRAILAADACRRHVDPADPAHCQHALLSRATLEVTSALPAPACGCQAQESHHVVTSCSKATQEEGKKKKK